MTAGVARRRWLSHLAMVGVYATLAVAGTYPLARDLTGALAGDRADAWLEPWRAWWAARSLGAGADPFFTQLLYFPQGTSLVFDTLDLSATIWAPLGLAFVSPLTFVNLTVLAALLGSAMGAYLLAFSVTGSVPAAVLAGLIYGFTPNRLDQARAHPEIAFGAWLPLVLLGGVWLLRARTTRQRVVAALVSGVALALALLAREAHAFAALALLPGLLLWQPVHDARLARRAAVGWLAVVFAVALAVASPWIVRVVRAWPPPPPAGAGMAVEQFRASVSLEAFVVPPLTSTLWGGLRRILAPQQPNGRAGRVAFLGVTVIVLLLWSIWRTPRDPDLWFWLLCGAGFALLSLGPRLTLWDQPTSLPLLFPHLPVMRLVRAPDRFVPAAVLGVAMTIAVGWAAAARRWPRRTLVALVPLAVLIAADLAMVPFPTMTPVPSPFYERVARDPETFALIEVPMNLAWHDKLHGFYQTLHGKPLQAGHVSRLPAAALATIERNGALRALRAAGDGAAAPPPDDVAADLRALAAMGFRYLVVHRRYRESLFFRPVNDAELALLARMTPVLGAPVYEDELLSAYDLRRAAAPGAH